MIIKVLGGGCVNCKILYNNVKSIIEELQLDAQVVEIEDYLEIAKYGVLSTPALVINEVVVGIAKLKYNKVKDLIKNV